MSDKTPQLPLISVPLPSDIFEADNATIQRIKRISIKRADELRDLSRKVDDLFFEELATVYPTWEGVLACDDLEPIEGDPKDDPDLFRLLDVQQLNWLLLHGIAYRPKAVAG